MFDFATLRKQVTDIKGKAQQATAENERLKNQRDLIAAAPTSKSDAKAVLLGSINAQATRHMALLAEQLGNLAAKGNPDRFSDLMLLSAAKPGTAATPQSLEAALFLMLGGEMAEAVDRLIEKMPWPTGSIDGAEKERKLRELDKQIADSEAELSALVVAARGAGISL